LPPDADDALTKAELSRHSLSISFDHFRISIIR